MRMPNTSSYVIEQHSCLPLRTNTNTNTKINITTCHSSCIIIILILFLLPTVYTFTLTRVSIGTNLDYPCSLARDGATLFVLPLGISTHCYDDDIHNPSELEANADFFADPSN